MLKEDQRQRENEEQLRKHSGSMLTFYGSKPFADAQPFLYLMFCAICMYCELLDQLHEDSISPYTKEISVLNDQHVLFIGTICVILLGVAFMFGLSKFPVATILIGCVIIGFFVLPPYDSASMNAGAYMSGDDTQVLSLAFLPIFTIIKRIFTYFARATFL